MMRLACCSLLILLLTSLSGCHFDHLGNTVTGSGVRKSEKHDLPAFTGIKTEGAFTVEVTSQKPTTFEIEADDNILPLIQVVVRNGVLYLKAEKGYNSRQGVEVRVTVPDLTRIESTGAGKFQVHGLKNDKFEVDSTGASTIAASGETKSVEIHTTGAGLVDTHNLHAAKANVSSTGAAKVDVYASEQLDASVSGVGHVSYSGDPKVVNKNTSGAATVTKREAAVN
jgi:hypothetical protein